MPWLGPAAVGLCISAAAQSGRVYLRPGELHPTTAVLPLRATLPPSIARLGPRMSLVLAIRTDGTVADARILHDQPGSDESGEPTVEQPYEARAIEEAKILRFQPVERDGHKVEAVAPFTIAFAPPALPPQNKSPFPPIPEISKVLMQIDGTPCYGNCPEYRLAIHGDGRLEFQGGGDSLLTGFHSGRISASEVRALIEKFRAADFFSYSAFEIGASDLPTISLTFGNGDVQHTVTDYGGEMIGMPDGFIELEYALSAIAAPWTEGDASTAAILAREHVDLRNRATEAILWRLAADPAIVRRFLKAGVSPVSEGQSPEWITPLIIAARAASWQSVNLLLGAAAGRQNPEELAMALCAAADEGDVKLVERLMQAGGRAPSAAEGGCLQDAAGAGSEALVDLFLRNGANPNGHRVSHDPRGGKDYDGATPLESAAQFANGQPYRAADFAVVIRRLAEAGADPNFQSRPYGTFALLGAHTPEVARALLAAGANPNLRDYQGKTALMGANSAELVRVLLAAGADPSLRDNAGFSALDYAQGSGRTDITALLQSAIGGK